MRDDRSPGEAGPRIPAPAHPHRRREPLPWHRPKGPQEDPEAPRRVRAILEDPGYRLAEADPDFLAGDAARGVRLQLDYLKAEQLLERHGIEHTIVVVGSTRIREPAAARRQAASLRAALADDPADVALAARLAVAERVVALSRYYDVARELGRLVGAAPREPGGLTGVVIATGGGPGMMEAANRGAFDAGAESVGFNIALPQAQYPNPYITPDLCFRFHYFAIRKLHFMLRARALVAFPGGYGTCDELFETLALIQTRKLHPMPVVLVGESYWRRAFDVEFLAAEGAIDPEDRELFWYAETAQQIWDGIRRWYALSGSPLERASTRRRPLPAGHPPR